jgi:dTDP-4-dehydrorhamnose 3,5-epimerase
MSKGITMMSVNMKKASDVSVEWLKNIPYRVAPLSRGATIDGVIIRDLKINMDGRGEVTELWSKPWIEQGLLDVQHVYQSSTDYGVVKAWHLHEVHSDQQTVTRGKLQITLVDLRESSPSFGHVNVVILGSLKPRLVKIPPMVMHGWKALSRDEVIVVNLQTHIYVPGDEYKFPWDCVLQDIWEPRNG